MADILVEPGQARHADQHQLLEPHCVATPENARQATPKRASPPSACWVSIRSDLEQIADPDVQASLAAAAMFTRWRLCGRSLSCHHLRRNAVVIRIALHSPATTHAKGGLGQVSLALDQELNREVALKQIQERYADDPNSRSRFLLEAEITGGLEHPGIVPVYGLGHYADGRPFYAMRFIRGDSLKEPSSASTTATARAVASGRLNSASSWAASSTSATPSNTPTAAACCTAT